MELHVYTDGACKGNPGKGGYAYTAYDEKGEVWVKSSGTDRETTNNKMELTAAIEAIRMIDKLYKNCSIRIYSDSAYLVNCFNDNWIEKWKENGWKTHKKEDVLNRELWEILDELVKKTGTTFERVPRKDLRIQQVDKEAKSVVKKLR
jgi:ribonuclease HI